MNKNNKEQYQRSFSTLHLSDDFRERIKDIPEDYGKVKNMKKTSIFGLSRVAAAVVTTATVLIGSAGVCYACDLGGIRTNLNLWINGSNQTVEVTDLGNGSYEYVDENGNEHGFGGVAIDEFGNETPLTAEDLAESMNNDCFLEKNEDGRYIFYYKNLQADVTDSIDSNGNLYVHVEDPSNEYTYFNFSEISDNGLSEYSDNKPLDGVDYLEIDSSDITITAPNTRVDDPLTTVGTCVITDED